MNSRVRELARELFEYHKMSHKLVKSDCILAMGSQDLRVAKRAAELFLEGLAPVLVCSGGFGKITKTIWNETEASKFASIARDMGVPKDKIILEERSTNTGDNIAFSISKLKDAGIDVKQIIGVQKPYLERRAFAACALKFPTIKLLMTSPQLSYDDYVKEGLAESKVINLMVGDLQRIKVYPEKGFQVPQIIPDEVNAAYLQLIEAGYDECLISGEDV